MSKDPAALFYIDTWLSSTAEMDADCRGWYLNLILHQYDKGDLPSDVERLAQLANVKFSEYQRFQQVWQQVLQHKFQQNDNGRLENSKVNEILRKREAFKEKRSMAGKISRICKVAYKMKYSDDDIETIKEHLKENTEHEIFKYLDNEQMLKQMLQQVLQLYINVNEIKNKNTDEHKKENNNGEQKQNPITLPWQDDDFKQAWQDWKEYKSSEFKFKFKSTKSEKTSLTELQNKANGDKNTAIQIIKKSIDNGWKGLFPLNNQNNSHQKNKEPTWQEREQTARQVADNLNKLDEYEREHGLNEGF